MLSFVVFRLGYFFSNKNHDITRLDNLKTTLLYFENIPLFLLVAYLLTLLSALLCMVRSERIFRLLCCALVACLYTLKFSFGKISHESYPWVISSFFMIFLSHKSPLYKSNNLLIIRLTQTMLLSHYFIAGIWKIRDLYTLDSITKSNLGLEQVALSFVHGDSPNIFFMNTIAKYPMALALSFVLVVALQISTIFPIVFQRGFKQWGFLFLLFHLLMGISMGAWFVNNALAIVFFLIVTEVLLAELKSQKE